VRKAIILRKVWTCLKILASPMLPSFSQSHDHPYSKSLSQTTTDSGDVANFRIWAPLLLWSCSDQRRWRWQRWLYAGQVGAWQAGAGGATAVAPGGEDECASPTFLGQDVRSAWRLCRCRAPIFSRPPQNPIFFRIQGPTGPSPNCIAKRPSSVYSSGIHKFSQQYSAMLITMFN
jgi:hypothetical protein